MKYPALPDDLTYIRPTYNGEHYISTGGFLPPPVGTSHQSSGIRTEKQLRFVWCILGDADLCDWMKSQDPRLADVHTDAIKRHLQVAQASDDIDTFLELEELRLRHQADVVEACTKVMGKPPTHVVNSGYGLHIYYELAKPATDAAIPKARAMNAAFVAAVNEYAGFELLDKGVHDTGTRILREPGSENTKGDTPVLVEVLDTTDTTIDLATLSLGNPTPKAEATDASFGTEDTIPLEVGALVISKRTTLGQLWHGTDHEDQSAADWAIANALLDQGISLSDVGQALLYRRTHVAPRTNNDALRYVTRTIESLAKRQEQQGRVYDRDSAVYLGQDLARTLDPCFHTTETGARQYVEENGTWSELKEGTLGKLAQRYDGCRTPAAKGGTRPIKLGNSSHIVREAMTSMYDCRGGDIYLQAKGVHFSNGVLYPDGRFEQHDRRHHILSEHARYFPYDPDAPCPRFDLFLEEIFDHEDERLFIMEFIGACMFGEATRYQKHPLLLGERARNGKSTLTHTIENLFPSAVVTAKPMQKWGDSFGLEPLLHSRINIVSDMSKAKLVDSETVKQVLTGDRVSANRKNEKEVSFIPRMGHVLAMNQLPPNVDHSDGFYRRFVVIVMNNVFEGSTADPHLKEKLLGELPGIAAKAVRAYADLTAREDYVEPLCSTKAKARWRMDNNVVAEYIDEEYDVMLLAEMPTVTKLTSEGAFLDGLTNYCAKTNRNKIGRPEMRARLRLLNLGDRYRTSRGNFLCLRRK